ncbi:MAG: adenine deaminase, partial [Alphaproteobacteria bacterium]
MTTSVELARRIRQARGLEPADLVIKGGRILNVADGTLEEGDVAITGDTIVGAYEPYEGRDVIDARGLVVAPGFIDTHVHVESSLVSPWEFERLVLPRGTTTVICDPHEIANVLGLDGIRYMLEAARELTLSLFVNLSSCVPSSPLETAGAALSAADLATLGDAPGVLGLAEVMSFPTVLAAEPGILAKLEAFQGRQIDGHAPLLGGRDLSAYAAVGIRTEHEATLLEEAREKLKKGMAILMREGSVAKNVATLAPLLTDYSAARIAFCTDDRNPAEILAEGHLDHAVRTAIAAGAPPMAAYRAASLAAAEAMGLRDRGLVAPGYRADLLLVEDVAAVTVERAICGGKLFRAGAGRVETSGVGRGSVKRREVTAAELTRAAAGPVPTIGVRAGSLITDRLERDPAAADVLTLAVLERHGKNGNIGLGHVTGFGPLDGAIGFSVGHDSHNLSVLGRDPHDLAVAANRLIALDGGAVAVRGGEVVAELALPIAGLMSDRPYEEVVERLAGLKDAVAAMGGTLDEPLLQLAFLPLVVIPHLKLSDRGLVDVDRFAVVDPAAG